MLKEEKADFAGSPQGKGAFGVPGAMVIWLCWLLAFSRCGATKHLSGTPSDEP